MMEKDRRISWYVGALPTKIDIDNYNFWTFLLNIDYNLTAHIIIKFTVSYLIYKFLGH